MLPHKLCLVTKLGLKTSPHPKPYAVQWLNQEKKIHVARRVLLAFSIGKRYKEELWCDVMPMDACHVLLGRPWLFDRRVRHDGYKNTYTFLVNHQPITLTPSIPIPPSENPPQETPTPQLTTLLKSQHHEFSAQQPLILLAATADAHPSPTVTPYPPAVAHLLAQYAHVFPAEVPAGLPPKRDIQHKIDLIPESVLPNKTAYKCNPTESAEIRRQVNE